MTKTNTPGEQFFAENVLEVEGVVNLLIFFNNDVTKDTIKAHCRETFPENKCRTVSGPNGSHTAIIVSEKFAKYLKSKDTLEGVFVAMQQWFMDDFIKEQWPHLTEARIAAKKLRRENRIKNKLQEIAAKDRKDLDNHLSNKTPNKAVRELRKLEMEK